MCPSLHWGHRGVIVDALIFEDSLWKRAKLKKEPEKAEKKSGLLKVGWVGSLEMVHRGGNV